MDIDAFTEKMKNRLEAKYAGKCQIYTDEQDKQLYWNTVDETYSFLIFKFAKRIMSNKLGGCISVLEVWNYSFDMENENSDIVSKNSCLNYYTTTEEKMEAQIFKSMKQMYNLVQNIDLLRKQKWVLLRKKEIEREFNDEEG